MMRSNLLFFALAAVAYLSAQPIPFERYYGRPEPWADEFAHRLEKWGDRHVVVATVERGESQTRDVVVYDFDPATGAFTDSLTLYPIPRPEVLATATTPDGYLYVAKRTMYASLIYIDRYDAMGTLDWQYAIDRPAGVQLQVMTVTPDHTLLLALRHQEHSEFVEVSTLFGERWTYDLSGSFISISAALQLPEGGNWVIAGQQFQAPPFVLLLAGNGGVIWKTDLHQAQQPAGDWYYGHLSALRYLAGTGTIQAFGGTTAGERAVVNLDLIGQRLSETKWPVPAHFGEEIAFLPNNRLISGSAAGFSLVDLSGEPPVILAQGSGFSVHRDLLFGEDGSFFQLSEDRTRPYDYQIRVRSVAVTGGLQWDHTYGRTGYNPVETLRAATVEPGGEFYYCFGSAPSATDPYALHLFKTDAAGTVLWEQSISHPTGETPQAWDLHWSADGNLLLLYGGLNDLFLAKHRPDGSPIWQRTLPREYLPLSEHFLLELADGSLLINDVVRENGVETVVLKRLSGTGTLLERMLVPGFERGRLRALTLVEDNQVLLSGLDGETFWGGRLTKFDLTTQSIPWTLALQPLRPLPTPSHSAMAIPTPLP